LKAASVNEHGPIRVRGPYCCKVSLSYIYNRRRICIAYNSRLKDIINETLFLL